MNEMIVNPSYKYNLYLSLCRTWNIVICGLHAAPGRLQLCGNWAGPSLVDEVTAVRMRYFRCNLIVHFTNLSVVKLLLHSPFLVVQTIGPTRRSLREPTKQTSRMVTYANKFTPEVLLSAPRRSAGRPNCDGTCALYTISTYSFESHSKSSEVRILDLKTTESTLLTSEASASEPNWLDRDTAIYLQGSDKGTTLLLSIDVTKPKQGFVVSYEKFELD
jgi:hypothetical protein